MSYISIQTGKIIVGGIKRNVLTICFFKRRMRFLFLVSLLALAYAKRDYVDVSADIVARINAMDTTWKVGLTGKHITFCI